jgi:trigger factor
MKAEFVDVSETRKSVTIEIPRADVDAEIDRIARRYARDAQLPGFRKGKVPASVIKKRFREQILHDVTHTLIPGAVQDALQERGIEPLDSPNVEKISMPDGEPLTFTAAVDTLPEFDPGDLAAITARRTHEAVTDEAVDQALSQVRERAARYEPVEGRPAADGDTVVMDLERRGEGDPETHEGVSVLIGGPGNPPGFDAEITGMQPGEAKTFDVTFPADYAVPEMAGTSTTYHAAVKELRRRVLPELDDEFARDLGLDGVDSLTALRDRVRQDLEAQATAASDRQVRDEVLRQLAERVTFEVPDSLVDAELDRRLQDLVQQMMAQQVDPRQAGIDWGQFRESQRDAARQAVKSALALDEVARREDVQVSAADIDQEIARFAARAERSPDAIRAQLEKEGRIPSLQAGLRREKALELATSRAAVENA